MASEGEDVNTTKKEKESMPAEYRAWLYGSLAAIAGVVVFSLGLGAIVKNGDNVQEQEKSEQVRACSSIREPNAAFLCVEQVDD